jgi:hypothetical protein
MMLSLQMTMTYPAMIKKLKFLFFYTSFCHASNRYWNKRCQMDRPLGTICYDYILTERGPYCATNGVYELLFEKYEINGTFFYRHEQRLTEYCSISVSRIESPMFSKSANMVHPLRDDIR